MTETELQQIYKEVEELKNEKLINHRRIRDLLDKLDEYVSINLDQDIITFLS